MNQALGVCTCDAPTKADIDQATAAYYALPLWKRYVKAKAVWEANWEIYCSSHHPAHEMREEYLRSNDRRTELLEQLRATPEHLAAFGWN
jgi:hypothetical protein